MVHVRGSGSHRRNSGAKDTEGGESRQACMHSALDALYNLSMYGVHYAIENQQASLRMLSLVQSAMGRLVL